jgi:hypothetical protein
MAAAAFVVAVVFAADVRACLALTLPQRHLCCNASYCNNSDRANNGWQGFYLKLIIKLKSPFLDFFLIFIFFLI